MLKFILLQLCLGCYCSIAIAQSITDSTLQTKEVVISASKGERLITSVPVPIKVINQAQLKQIGAISLAGILQEQTGLSLTNDHGLGIQLQGIDPDYTLILIDGEPMIGRTAGTLDLTRLDVLNLERVEIMKGPVSSLYGSEAMGGVINLITKKPSNKIAAELRTRATSLNEQSYSALLSGVIKNFKTSILFHYLQNTGYSFSKDEAPTVAPLKQFCIQPKLEYLFSNNLKVQYQSRFQTNNSLANFDQQSNQIRSSSIVNDFSNTVSATKSIKKIQLKSKVFWSEYYNNTYYGTLDRSLVYDDSFFRQKFLRPEMQADWYVNNKLILLGGVGYIKESVEATRYSKINSFETYYFFSQAEYQATKKLNLQAGVRGDWQTVYGKQLSPKLAVGYDPLRWLSIKGSVGRGFKAPDFRQLYLNFVNQVAGYSVFGTEEAVSRLADLQAANQIAIVYSGVGTGQALVAETSTSFNFGFKVQPTKRLNININLFQNNIQNLIETQVIARTVSGQNIFSYQNIGSIYTKGFETDLSLNINKHFTLNVGYQYLLTGNFNVIDQIKNGNYFTRNPNTLSVERLSIDNYGGLFNRSKHMANFKLFFSDSSSGWGASIRLIFRGKYGFSDMNGNGILDNYDQFVNSYSTTNLNVQKSFLKEKLNIQLGVDNLFDFVNSNFIPTLPGRIIWLNVSFKLQPFKQSIIK